jgi:hypothetical protein
MVRLYCSALRFSHILKIKGVFGSENLTPRMETAVGKPIRTAVVDKINLSSPFVIISKPISVYVNSSNFASESSVTTQRLCRGSRTRAATMP